MDQTVSLGQVIFKNHAPIFNRVPRLSPQGQQMYNADGTLQMMNSQEVIGTKYNLSCSGLDPRFQDIVVKIDGDLAGQNPEQAPFDSFEPVLLEGLEMNPWGQDSGNGFTSIQLSWKATGIKSTRKGKQQQQAS